MTRFHKTACPYCDYAIDRHAAVTLQGKPEPRINPGSISFCVRCGQFSKFDSDLDLIRLEPREEADVRADPRCAALIEAFRQIKPLS